MKSKIHHAGSVQRFVPESQGPKEESGAVMEECHVIHSLVGERQSQATRPFNGSLQCFWDDCSLLGLRPPGRQPVQAEPTVFCTRQWLVISMRSVFPDRTDVCLLFLLNDDGRFPMIKIQFHIF